MPDSKRKKEVQGTSRNTPKLSQNVELKTAICITGKKNYVIANEADILPCRLSYIVNGIYPAKEYEKKQIAKALGAKVSDLFDEVTGQKQTIQREI